MISETASKDKVRRGIEKNFYATMLISVGARSVLIVISSPMLDVMSAFANSLRNAISSASREVSIGTFAAGSGVMGVGFRTRGSLVTMSSGWSERLALRFGGAPLPLPL